MPSHHSSGSHSSHSFSSHSSRSSFSSHSSRSYSSPSHHSYSSHSSFGNGFSSTGRRSYRSAPIPPIRPRRQQPTGYNINVNPAPRYFHCTHHTYVFYPTSWIDTASGTEYRSGYYDENGTYYKELNNNNNFSDGLLLQCPYCETSKVVKWSEAEGTIDMTCPNCSAQMEIKSSVDKLISESDSEDIAVDYTRNQSSSPAFSNFIRILIIIVVLFSIWSFMRRFIQPTSYQSQPYYDNPTTYNNDYYNIPSNPEIFGETIRVKKDINQGLKISNSGSYDYTLVWDDYEESYYCEELDEWFWYNNYVEPAVWQYWKESISSDYGDYGWMEHDSEGWWIEVSENNWGKVPNYYDTSKLAYIEK